MNTDCEHCWHIQTQHHTGGTTITETCCYCGQTKMKTILPETAPAYKTSIDEHGPFNPHRHRATFQ